MININQLSESIKGYFNRSNSKPIAKLKPTEIFYKEKEVDELALEKKYIKARKDVWLIFCNYLKGSIRISKENCKSIGKLWVEQD